MSDWDDIKRLYIQPARGCGKSQLQLQMYQELLKGEQKDMDFKGWLSEKNIRPFAPPVINVNPESEKVEQIDIPEPAPTPTQEEWVWVKGYKGTDKNMRCQNDYQYELGKQFDMVDGEEILLCHSGFHFCKTLKGVFRYYPICDNNRFFEIEALVKKPAKKKDRESGWTYVPYIPSYSEDKHVAKSIRFVRELSVNEVFEAVASADVREWTDDQKKKAMEIGTDGVRQLIKVDRLTAIGYSEPCAMYIAQEPDWFARAMAVGSQPDLSMDVKIMTIFCIKH